MSRRRHFPLERAPYDGWRSDTSASKPGSTALPFELSGWLWIVLLVAASVTGFLLTLSYFGWTRRLLPLAVFLSMPATVLGILDSNSSPIIFLGLSAGLWMVRRNPLLVGAALTVTWLKPSVALPLAALLVVFQASDRGRIVLGVGATTLFGLLLTMVTTGPSSLIDWLHGLSGYAIGIAAQPEISSLTGLYFRTASAELRSALEAAQVVGAATICFWWLLLNRATLPVPFARSGWLWALWLLATPYVHSDDTAYLAAPLVAVFGANASRFGRPLPTLALYLLFAVAVGFRNPTAVAAALLELVAVAAILAYFRTSGYAQEHDLVAGGADASEPSASGAPSYDAPARAGT